MAFWPTVLSGPVCRLPEMLPQFREAGSDWEDVSTAMRRVIGLFMKPVLAEMLGAGLLAGKAWPMASIRSPRVGRT